MTVHKIPEKRLHEFLQIFYLMILSYCHADAEFYHSLQAETFYRCDYAGRHIVLLS